MTFRDEEKKHIVAHRDAIFRDPGYGTFKGKQYPFILKDARLNLWDGIREDVYEYFAENKVTWWGGEKYGVTGHLLSSQVACLNHLYPIRQRQDMATAILKTIRDDIISAEIVDDGFVEFEVIGNDNYLGEKSHSRGINATSVDAVMVGKKKDGRNLLVLIEWKYTEDYSSKNLYIPARAKIYDPLLKQPDCPIQVEITEKLFFEPYYQLMRQTLLGWLMVQNNEYNCDEYLHIHVIPEKNFRLRETITSPRLEGNSMSDAWLRLLKKPEQYIVISPEKFLMPIALCTDSLSIKKYLSERYWN